MTLEAGNEWNGNIDILDGRVSVFMCEKECLGYTRSVVEYAKSWIFHLIKYSRIVAIEKKNS